MKTMELEGLASRAEEAERRAREARALLAEAQAAAAIAARRTAEEAAEEAAAAVRAARPGALLAVLDLLDREERILDGADRLVVEFRELEQVAAATSSQRATARLDNPRVGLVIGEHVRALYRAAGARRRSLAKAREDAQRALDVLDPTRQRCAE